MADKAIINYARSCLSYRKFSLLKRFALILLLCFGWLYNYAQERPLKLNSYAERFFYVDSVRSSMSDATPAQRIERYLVLSKKAEDAGDLELAGKLKLQAYEGEMRQPNMNKADMEKKFADMIAYADENELPYLKADALEYAGDFHWEFSRHETAAMENFVAAYNIYNKFSPDEFPAKQQYITSLGGAYYRYEDNENCIRYMQEALNTKAPKGHSIYLTVNNTIGLCYRRIKNYDSALLYFKKVYDSASRSKEPRESIWATIAGGNIGITYFQQGKYDEAIPLLDTDIERSLATNQIKNAAASMSTRAAIYYYKKDYDKAEQLLLKALHICESKPFWPAYNLAADMYTWLYKVYAAKGDIRHAYIYADSAIVAKDSNEALMNSLNLAKANEKLSYVQKKLDEEKLNDRIKLDQLALSKKRIEATFFFVGIVVLLLVIVFIARERRRSENILLNILPEKIAERLKKREHPIADYFENASILFIDMAGFTSFADGRNPKDVVNILNSVFTEFDRLADKHGLEKIKTIGDCYMAVSGLPEPNPHHAEAAAEMAIEIKSEMARYKADDGTPITFRMGLDCGPVVAGVIGRRKFIYDLWGDTVNTASRMETTGIAGEIHCSDRFKKQIDGKYKFTSRGSIEVKGKGMMETWLMIEPK